MLPATFLESSVQRLLVAERTGVPIDPLTDSCPELSEEDAYRVQDMTIMERGEDRVGYKLGFTSQAMREQMDIPNPNYGQLTEGMWVEPPANRIELSKLIHPRVEPEVALLVEKTKGAKLPRTSNKPDRKRLLGSSSKSLTTLGLRIHLITHTHLHTCTSRCLASQDVLTFAITER